MYWEHSSSLAEVAQTLSDADALVFGDAEGVIDQLVEEIQQPSPKALTGTVYLHTPGPSLLGPDSAPNWPRIDTTPIPDWGLLRRLRINGELGNEFTEVSLEEGRGCTFKCSYCAFPLYNSFRRKSAERIVREIESIYDAGFRKVAFVGAEFFHPISIVRETAERLAARALPVEIWVFGRIDLLAKHPDLPCLLSRAGIRNINFGLESGDRSIQQAMNKKIQLDRIPGIMDNLHKAGIRVAASLVLGFPGETHQTVRNTAAVISDCGFDYVMIHSLQVVPGTPLWRRREEFGLSMPRPRVWMHKTMGLHQLPEQIRYLARATIRDSDSLLNNVKQYITPTYLPAGSSEKDNDAVTRILQRVICNEFESDEGVRDQGRRDGMNRLFDALASMARAVSV